NLSNCRGNLRSVETRERRHGISRATAEAHLAGSGTAPRSRRGQYGQAPAKGCAQIYSWSAVASRLEQRRVGIAGSRSPLSPGGRTVGEVGSVFQIVRRAAETRSRIDRSLATGLGPSQMRRRERRGASGRKIRSDKRA